MNKVRRNIKILLGFLIISCTVYAQNPTADNNTPKASFTIDNTDFDYGKILESAGLAEHIFIIKNTGNNPLVIKQVVPSCGCTTPDWTKEPIASGKTGEIKVAYNPAGVSGPFNKGISVYCDNADPVQLTIKGTVEKNNEVKVPTLSFAETSHNFGEIGENDGYAEHVFKFTNTGNAPLTVTQVQATCGCTRPEWTKTPVEPGQEGIIIVSFDPRGRLGGLNKSATVYTNEDGGYKRHKLTILGTVVEKPRENTSVVYLDTIGGVGTEKKDLVYRTLLKSEINNEVVVIKNYNTETAYFSWENVPDYIKVQSPDSLKADWQDRLFIGIDEVQTREKRGRFSDKITWTIKNREGKVLGSDVITLTANYIDDFSQLSPLQSAKAAVLEIKSPIIEFGEIKGGFLGMGGNVSKQLLLTNTGKSDLVLHSVSGEDSRVHLPDLKGKTIKAGESLAVDITVKAKELGSDNINTDIYVVCNDPKGPVRLINVLAQKAK